MAKMPLIQADQECTYIFPTWQCCQWRLEGKGIIRIRRIHIQMYLNVLLSLLGNEIAAFLANVPYWLDQTILLMYSATFVQLLFCSFFEMIKRSFTWITVSSQQLLTLTHNAAVKAAPAPYPAISTGDANSHCQLQPRDIPYPVALAGPKSPAKR